MEQGSELLANIIAEKIKYKIQSMEYKADERLPVRQLCKTFDTSETPVKQALNQLVSIGLVVATPNCGMRVRSFTYEDMKNVIEARLMIEQYCAREAVIRCRQDSDYSQKICSLLEANVAAYELCIQEYTKENFVHAHEGDGKLHKALVDAARNVEIIRLYQTLNTHAGMYTSFEKHTPATLAQVNHEHRAIVDALMLCDTDGVRSALEQHVKSTLRIFGSEKAAE